MALTLHGTVSDNTAVLDRRSAKPLIINGDMAVAQRATSVTNSADLSGPNCIDRMRVDNNTLGVYTIAQTASAPDDTGLVNSYRLDCTTADASPAAADFLIFSTKLEGQDVQVFKKGTSYAEKMTISFWVKSNKTGTYIMEIDDNDNARNINQAYTISSANTWEKKVLSFAGDTTGAFDNDNGDSLRLLWWLGAGSDFTSGSLQTSWGATSNTDRAVGNVNLSDSTANDWSITGIQLEVGEFDANSIAPFQHESFGDSLQRCQRYLWQEKNDTGSTKYSTIGLAQGTGRGYGVWQINEMRTAPTVSVSNVAEFLPLNGAGAPQADFTTLTNSLSTKTMVFLDLSGSSGLTSGQACPIGINDGNYVRGDAEL
jgi:hypothetical protein